MSQPPQGDSGSKPKWNVESVPFVPSSNVSSRSPSDLASTAAYVPTYIPSGAQEYVPSQPAAANYQPHIPPSGHQPISKSNKSNSNTHSNSQQPITYSQRVQQGLDHQHQSVSKSNRQTNLRQVPAYIPQSHPISQDSSIGNQQSKLVFQDYKPQHSSSSSSNSANASNWNHSRLLGPLSVHASTRGSGHYFMSEQLRRELLGRSALCLRGSDPDDPKASSFPPVVHRYHSLYPLEDLAKDKVSKVYGVPTFMFKATDGIAQFAIRKIDQVRVNELNNAAIESWKTLIHPHVISLRETFVSNAFNNTPSIFISYEYHPAAETLEQRFPASAISEQRPPGFQQEPKGLSEDLVWAILTQLVSALKAIHTSSLCASKLLNGSKIVIVGKFRLRLGSVGVEDLLKFDNRKVSLATKQHEDIIALGQLMLRLAAPLADSSFASVQKALEKVALESSPELHAVLLRLLGLGSPQSSSLSSSVSGGNKQNSGSSHVHNSKHQTQELQYPTLDELQQMIASKAFMQLDRLHNVNDALENELAKELDNGRLFRLMVKLGFINERPEYDFSTQWSDTGDRFPLKLFRDYVFHQVDEEGRPVLDLSHVVECLNKLDAAVEEKVLLMSRDERTMIVVKYKELAKYLSDSFQELVKLQSNQQLNR